MNSRNFLPVYGGSDLIKNYDDFQNYDGFHFNFSVLSNSIVMSNCEDFKPPVDAKRRSATNAHHLFIEQRVCCRKRLRLLEHGSSILEKINIFFWILSQTASEQALRLNTSLSTFETKTWPRLLWNQKAQQFRIKTKF